MNFKYDNNITVYGTKAEIDNAIKALDGIYVGGSEAVVRLVIQEHIDKHNLKADILYDGNTVWSKKKVIAGIKKVKKNGMQSMTKYLYNFLSLSCGSIAHYNIYGWIDTYPTIDDLRRFFLKNEFGRRVLEHLPRWNTDAHVIVEEIETELGIN